MARLQGHPDPLGQHGGDVLDHQSGQHIPDNWRRGPTRRFLDVIAGAPERENSPARDQCEDLAAANAIPRVQGQRRPLQLRPVMFDRNSGQQHVPASPAARIPPWNPLTRTQASESVFADLTSYKNRNGAIRAPRGDSRLQEREGGRQRERLYARVGHIGRSALRHRS